MIFADLEGALCRADLLDQTDSFLLEDCFKSENLLTKFGFQELSENRLLSLLQTRSGNCFYLRDCASIL